VFDWLFEGRPSVYIALAGVAVLLLILWWQRRKRGLLFAAVFVAALIGVYAVLDVSVETDREQIVRKINAMIAAVNAHKLDDAFIHISDQFRSAQGKSKAELRAAAEMFLKQKIVESVKIWDITMPEQPSREHPPARVFFSVKASGVQEFAPADCDATFDFDPQHGWRLSGFRLLVPQTTQEYPWQV
jgi:hypothetical protein